MIKRLLTGLAFSLMLIPSNALATDSIFPASITIYAPIVVTKTADLIFPNTASSAAPQTVVVAPGGVGAASFDIAGEPTLAINATVVEASIIMANGPTNITVDQFVFGGTLTDAAGSGTASLDGVGNLVGASVGATATIPANPTQGAYTGNLTFQVTYQ